MGERERMRERFFSLFLYNTGKTKQGKKKQSRSTGKQNKIVNKGKKQRKNA